MNKPETTQSTPIVSTPRGTTVIEPSRFYPSCPVYQYPQYPQYYEPQYVQPTPQYIQPTPQYIQPTPQYATVQYHQYPQYQYPSQYLPDGCYCEIQYVIPYIVSKSNSSHSSPVASSQPPQESLMVSM